MQCIMHSMIYAVVKYLSDMSVISRNSVETNTSECTELVFDALAILKLSQLFCKRIWET